MYMPYFFYNYNVNIICNQLQPLNKQNLSYFVSWKKVLILPEKIQQLFQKCRCIITQKVNPILNWIIREF